jgi:hypothetical protein
MPSGWVEASVKPICRDPGSLEFFGDLTHVGVHEFIALSFFQYFNLQMSCIDSIAPRSDETVNIFVIVVCSKYPSKVLSIAQNVAEILDYDSLVF